MSKLWQKTENSQLNKAIEAFEVGEDYILDRKLVQYDVYGSIAHGRMLMSIGILSPDEYGQIKAELIKILEDHEKGEFIIKVEDEDVHSKVENRLTEEIGDAGKKIHTARSRNDQVLVDTRLYTKNELLSLKAQVLSLTSSLLNFAKEHEFVPMPGYTHMQIAMPSSIGMWASAFVESFLDELPFLNFVYDLNDQSPLGSGAGYGVSVPIDRDMCSQLLGFKRIQKNALYCGNSRGKIEANVISSIVSLGLVLNKMATDLLLFTTKEFDFFEVADEITTGSSIMPQKKNLDVLELIRAKISSLLGLELSIKSLITNLMSGYNRDFQDTKKFLIQAFEIINPCLALMELCIDQLKPKEENLVKAHKSEIYATDAAYQMVEKGTPFRDAYRYVGTHLDELAQFDPYETIKNRKAIGTTGNLQLDQYDVLIDKENALLETQVKHWQETVKKLLG